MKGISFFMIRNMWNNLRFKYHDFLWNMKRLANDNDDVKIYYDAHYQSWPINVRAVLYEMQDGQELDDSPFAILREWISSGASIEHIIVAKENEIDRINRVLKFWDLIERQNIRVVIYESKEHMRWLLTAKYIITNAMIFSDIFVKRPGQIFVNTWHGTPLKKMGYAMPGGVMGSWNVIRNVLMTNYLILPNAYTAEIFKKDYRLDNLYTGRIILGGYPRNDILVTGLPKKQLQKFHDEISLDSEKQLILYAPTWSGDTTIIHSSSQELEVYLNTLESLSKIPNTIIIFKPHPYFQNAISLDRRFETYLIPDYFGTNVILSQVDLLITDYSSLFFDYLTTGRPIIFFDSKENYQNERGTYLKISELPGPYTKEISSLIGLVQDIPSWHECYIDKYARFRQRFVSYEDGMSSQRMVDIIKSRSDEKSLSNETILFNGEDFSDKNFTESHRKLVKRISLSYDISVAIFESHVLEYWYGYQFFANIDSVSKYTRVFVNKNSQHRRSGKTEVALNGRRMTAAKQFNMLVIPQSSFSYHQKELTSTAEMIIMAKNPARELWLLKIGFTRSLESKNWEVFGKGHHQNLEFAKNIMKMLEEKNVRL